MSIQPERRVSNRPADSRDETSGIILMLGLFAIFCVLVLLFA